ncbi:hypothetical protein MVEN_00033600 [Mycena venus]|uniref:Uncharacterized protein n=1 Tax=Mycena venus TaxID=2733690 RepID=A0A8H7DEU3_9AGAR|nr:hypothetical protein MVEN_00033600 [Mycena venus]
MTDKEEIKLLKEQLAEARKDHEDMVGELVEEADELRYRLAVASGNLEDTTSKLTELKHQLFDLRQLVLRVGNRLISWEKRESEADLAEELATTRRFIGTVGGELWDGAKETVHQHQRRIPRETDSESE